MTQDKWRRIAVVFAMATVWGCGERPILGPVGPGSTSAPTTVKTLRVQVREGTTLVVRTVPLEDYVAATILSEFDPASGDQAVVERMFEVQAIVSRSYALSQRARHAHDPYDVCSDARCQVYEPARLRTSRWADLARRAVDRTRGQVLLYRGVPAETLFHADCGGYTSSAAAVWGGAEVPYLVAARDSAEHPPDDWTFGATGAALRDALDADPRTAVGSHLVSLEVIVRDAAGRAEKIALKGSQTVIVRGEVFREVVNRRFGVKSIRSTLFNVSRTAGGFGVRGKGSGHGVGLCQAGALARLQGGATPRTVLAHYFPGTVLSRSELMR